VIGHSVLRSGTVTASLTCELPFTVTDLPTGKKAYSVEVAGTGEISFTEEEAKHNPGVTWGY
jgi:hypothetical protein